MAEVAGTVAGVIDFEKQSVFKLAPCAPEDIASQVSPILIQGEQIVSSFKTVRDFVVFTNKRVIAVNVQGMTGRKKDFTSLPYSRVQAFSIETAGTFDMDAELDLWFSGLGQVRLEFKGHADVRLLGQIIATFIL
ncbi:PH domain-containing protein [Saccharothrix stipae]